MKVFFRSDLYELYKHFKLFSDSQVLGVATDQTPHYYDKSRSFREASPSSSVGSQGIMQGFNTGVALYDLEKMRGSEVYRDATNIEEMIRLEKKYNIRGTVGDQVRSNSLSPSSSRPCRIGSPCWAGKRPSSSTSCRVSTTDRRTRRTTMTTGGKRLTSTTSVTRLPRLSTTTESSKSIPRYS